ncbi:hypothetical protein [Seonamhaeicola marinus]|uniref:DUF3575 domain-containing protein n=1 Tax=Seonamhaeicola marinus TaxID=1912246 RepID=A0A5D0HKN1_9FLAO|nr:hypothetical protein [Seonamhaeicola marinus]TYA71954.1 hypothetical protein FUA24_20615 [Seonamhaeicola marinus]
MRNICLLVFIINLSFGYSQDTNNSHNWFDTFNYKKTFSKNYNGWKVSYIGFNDSDTDFILPFELSFGQNKAKTKALNRKGYESLDTYNISPGFNGLIKITSGFYLELGLNASIGLEVLKDLNNTKSKNFLIGLSSNQGIKIIPWKEFGLVFGASVFETIQTSKVYKTNLGFAFELGVNL